MMKAESLSRRRFLQSLCASGALLASAGLTAGLCPLNAQAKTPGRRTEQQSRLLMGTIVTLTVVSNEPALAGDAFAAAFAEMERLIGVFDRHSSDSAIGLLNDSGSLSFAPAELVAVLDASRHLSRRTENVFNPAIAPVVDLFAARPTGFSSSELKEVLALAEPGAVRLDASSVRLERQGMRLTLDGIAKGYIADRASQILLRHGLRDHMVNAGGDIRCSGLSAAGKAWTVGIQHPARAGELLAAATVENCGIATSGSYEQYYNRSRTRHHLISHLTGRSADIASVTVRAESAMQADALATALAFMPPAEAVRFAERSKAACFIADSAGRQYWTANWG